MPSKRKTKAKKNSKPLHRQKSTEGRRSNLPSRPPLREFDARLVQAPLQGLFRNTDSELARRFQKAMASRDRESERSVSLFLILTRFTKISYSSASFLISSVDDSPNRKKEFALVLPPINRQLMDMLFNVVYITDDFPTRSLEYELYGYRQAREQYDQVHARFGSLPNWERHFAEQQDFLKGMEQYLPLTEAQKADPSHTIRYWVGPARLIRRPSKSQPFLKFFNAWFYSEASAQAHLNPAGLFSVAMFLISEFAPDGMKANVDGVMFEQFKFKHFSRTLVLVLAILSEIDTFCDLGNRDALLRSWGILRGYAEEAGDVYDKRYGELLTKSQC